MNTIDLLTKDPKEPLRIIQETVPGKQISLAHIIGVSNRLFIANSASIQT